MTLYQDERKAFSYALKLLSIKNYCSNQLKEKMLKKGFVIDHINKAIKSCIDKGYLNDEEYTRIWIEDRINRKPTSKAKMIFLLKQQGLPEELISKYIDELVDKEEELKMIVSLIAKKTKLLKDIDETSIKKIMANLYRNGHPLNLIKEAVQDIHNM